MKTQRLRRNVVFYAKSEKGCGELCRNMIGPNMHLARVINEGCVTRSVHADPSWPLWEERQDSMWQGLKTYYQGRWVREWPF